MRKIIYHVATSLDNFICHPDGSIDGFVAEGDHVADYQAHLQQYDTVIMGRSTYTFGYRFGLPPGARAYPHMRHLIFSQSLTLPGSEVEVVATDPLPVVERLKAGDGTPIYLCGGGTFAGYLLQHQLIDELVVKLNPFLMGKGVRLFETQPRPLKLAMVDSKTYHSGVMLLHYRVQYEAEIRDKW